VTWRFFYPSGPVADDETASSMFQRVARAEAKIAAARGRFTLTRSTLLVSMNAPSTVFQG